MRAPMLFVGHDESAGRAAAALTLIVTCKKLGIQPRRYLRETLAKILGGEKDLTALLPETYAVQADVPLRPLRRSPTLAASRSDLTSRPTHSPSPG